jgi:hypothetical protein
MTTTEFEQDRPAKDPDDEAMQWLDIVEGTTRTLMIERLAQAHLMMDPPASRADRSRHDRHRARRRKR